MTDEELRMEAYYYSFDTTGQVEIDRILSAVACAGKAFHYTGDWNDDATPRTFHEGATPIDWIQNRAKEAADTIEALRAENARLRGQLDALTGPRAVVDTFPTYTRIRIYQTQEAADERRKYQ